MRVMILIDTQKDSVAAILPVRKYLTDVEKVKEELVKAGVVLGPKRENACTDYSEEAIPERDPAHQTHNGTLYETQTIEDMPAHVRLSLARQLEALGMSPARAAMVSSL